MCLHAQCVRPWQLHGLQPAQAPLSLGFDFPGKIAGVVCHFLLRDLLDPGTEPMSVSPALAGRLSLCHLEAPTIASLTQLTSLYLLPEDIWESITLSLEKLDLSHIT